MWNLATKRKWLVQLIIIVPIFIALPGIAVSRVLPSEIGMHIGQGVGALVAIGWMYVSVIKRQLFVGVGDGRFGRLLLRNTVLRSLFMGGIGFMMGFAAFTWTGIWLFDMAAGSPAQKTAVLSGWIGGGYRNCREPKIYDDNASSPSALCVKKSLYREFPIGTHLRLVGSRTVLGFNVDKYYFMSRRPVAKNAFQLKHPNAN